MAPFLRLRSISSASLTGLALAVLLALAAPTWARDVTPTQNFYDHNLYPLSKPRRSPRVRIDIADAPETRVWAVHAQKLVVEWFPLITRFLATRDFKPPRAITLVFKRAIDPPAYANGDSITIKVPWITAHPDDLGMVIHELTHIIQAYPDQGDKPGWLVEGIADYIRFYRYEPDVPRPRINPQTATYHDAYRTTAAFLAWVTGRYDRGIVYKLDEALRKGAYSVNLFKEATGKPVDTLWAEFVQTLPAPAMQK